MKKYNRSGTPKVDVGAITIANAGDFSVSNGKINILNDSDSLNYTLCVQNINGQPVPYLLKSGNMRRIGGVYYILNDTDGLWYGLGCQLINNQAVLYPKIPGISL